MYPNSLQVVPHWVMVIEEETKLYRDAITKYITYRAV